MDLKKYEKFYEALGLREHPLGVFYTDNQPVKGLTPKEGTHVCLIGMLNRARQQGDTVYFDAEHTGCFGGAYYLGFRAQARPNIEYFLSCGIPGEMEGERYIKTPELAKEYLLPQSRARLLRNSVSSSLSMNFKRRKSPKLSLSLPRRIFFRDCLP